MNELPSAGMPSSNATSLLKMKRVISSDTSNSTTLMPSPALHPALTIGTAIAVISASAATIRAITPLRFIECSLRLLRLELGFLFLNSIP
jgi:hypothetical protein